MVDIAELGMAVDSRDAASALELISDRIRRVGDASGLAQKKSNTAFQKLRKNIFSIRSAVIGLGGAVAFKSIISGASAFEKKMSEVSTLLSDTSDFDNLTKSVKEISLEFGAVPTEQASALYQIISAGASTSAEAIANLTAANRLAIGGVTDVKTAADGLTSTLNAFGESAGTVTDISDAMFVAMRAGKTTIAELSQAIGFAAPLAAQAGVSLEELLAATAALTKGGVATQRAMRGLGQVMAVVVKPSSEATTMAKELGLEFNAAALQAKGFADFLKDVIDKTGGSTEKLAQLFGGVESLVPVLALAGSVGKDFTQILGDMSNRSGETEAAVSKMKASFDFKVDKLSSSFELLKITLGNALLPTITSVVEKLRDMFDSIAADIKIVRDFIDPSENQAKAMKIWESSVRPLVPLMRDLGISVYNLDSKNLERMNMAMTALKNAGVDIQREAGLAIMREELVKLSKLEFERSKSLKIVTDAYGANSKAAKLQSAELENVRSKLDESLDAYVAVTTEQKNFVETTEKVNETTHSMTQEMRDLLDVALPVEAATREYEQAVAMLGDALDAGDISLTQYNIAVSNLYSNLSKLEGKTIEVAKAADPVAEIYKRTASNIQDAFSYTFRSVFDEGLSGFKNLSDNILSVFKNMLAQMLTLAIAKPVIIPVVQQLGAGLGIQQAGINAVAGQLGGASFAGGAAGIAAGAGTQGLYATGGTASATSGFGASLSAAAPYVLAALAVNELTGGGLFGGKKKKVADEIQLGFEEGAFSGQRVETFKSRRALFRGTRTRQRFSELDDELATALNEAFAGTEQSIVNFGEQLGVDLSNALDDFTATFKGKSEDVGVLIEQITQQMFIHAFEGMDELQTVVESIDFSNTEQAALDLAFAVSVLSGKMFELDDRTQSQKTIDQISDQFHEMIRKGLELGLSEDTLNKLASEMNKQLSKLTADFNTSVADEILKIVDPQGYALQEFEKLAKDRIDNAKDLGADLLAVEQLNALQRKQIVEQFAVDTVQTLGEFFDTGVVEALRGVTDFVAGMGLSQYSVLTPSQRLSLAENSFESALAKAGIGDLAAIQSLPDVAEALLSEGRSFYGATEGFQNIFARVEEALSGVVLNQADPIIAQMQNSDAQAYENAQMIVDALIEMKQEITNLRADNLALSDTLTRVLAA